MNIQLFLQTPNLRTLINKITPLKEDEDTKILTYFQAFIKEHGKERFDWSENDLKEVISDKNIPESIKGIIHSLCINLSSRNEFVFDKDLDIEKYFLFNLARNKKVKIKCKTLPECTGYSNEGTINIKCKKIKKDFLLCMSEGIVNAECDDVTGTICCFIKGGKITLKCNKITDNSLESISGGELNIECDEIGENVCSRVEGGVFNIKTVNVGDSFAMYLEKAIINIEFESTEDAFCLDINEGEVNVKTKIDGVPFNYKLTKPFSRYSSGKGVLVYEANNIDNINPRSNAYFNIVRNVFEFAKSINPLINNYKSIPALYIKSNDEAFGTYFYRDKIIQLNVSIASEYWHSAIVHEVVHHLLHQLFADSNIILHDSRNLSEQEQDIIEALDFRNVESLGEGITDLIAEIYCETHDMEYYSNYGIEKKKTRNALMKAIGWNGFFDLLSNKETDKEAWKKFFIKVLGKTR